MFADDGVGTINECDSERLADVSPGTLQGCALRGASVFDGPVPRKKGTPSSTRGYPMGERIFATGGASDGA